MSGWRRFLATNDSLGPLLLRLTLGLVMFAHGAQKVLGWFGGGGVQATFAAFEQSYGLPPALTVLPMAAELGGGILLIVGAFTRLAAFGIGFNMLVAVVVGGHMANGFFMNWTGNQPGEGSEFHILAIGMAGALMVLGAGAASVDRSLSHRDEERVVTRPATVDGPTTTTAPAPREPAGAGRR